MVKNFLQIFLALVGLFFAIPSVAQDPEFSQFYSAPMNLNPALSGIAYGPRFNLNFRNEWPKIEKGYITTAFSYDQHFERINSGVGFFIMNDRVADGLIKSITVRASYSYQIRLADKVGLRIGLNAGLTNKRLDLSRLYFNDQIDPLYGFQNVNGLANVTSEQLPASGKINNPDFGAGFVAYSPNIYGGLSFQHIIPFKETLIQNDSSLTYKAPVKATIHAGGVIDLTPKKRESDKYISPNALVTLQSGASQLNVGVMANIEFIYFGAYYRHTFRNNDAVIGLVGFKAGYFRMGYSYDFTISELESSGGAHEVSMMINFGSDNGPLDPSRKTSRLKCPSSLNF
ncbi:MAG: PorP/SprF family type IX secretion system membrane protein [Chitinophagales bacterium]|nr:PorP/SprF family type IX secretion system membrane protein [Chitinophagales bacterium]